MRRMGRWLRRLLLVRLYLLFIGLLMDVRIGTFGSSDFIHSLLGEATDHIVRFYLIKLDPC